ncbi:hypothetical protein EXE46_02330 [Halorubrum sp. GN11_10-6_MGM]|uniref:hypothetical protein n=1 Tax=Halorubrum sp. GN11_10-6_MGM TaxID=2518112 RepID=UPI0010F862A6|nr:hypothetical protein [Halorubrum sp. GN11_10-6_MGM]TKX75605.1 hypothetical protein EXE46_02330 [Halorubrum sp. GN11_10-6_MGM]
MSDVETAIREAFEHTEYDLGNVAVNRRQVRVPVRQESADPDALRAVIEEALGADALATVTVTTERIGGEDTVGTVVSFRHRS